jgi:GT2 family glycosyltransferase
METILPPKVYIIILNYNGWEDTIECLESVLKNDYVNYQIIVIDNASPNNSMQHIIDWAEGNQDIKYNTNTKYSAKLRHLTQPFEPKPLPYYFYSADTLSQDDSTIKQTTNQRKSIIFIQSAENRGFANGNNIGIKYALKKNDFSYIWLLNNDTVIERDTLSVLIKYAEKNKIGVCGSILKNYNKPMETVACGGKINRFLGTSKHLLDEKNSKNPKEIDYVIGASFLIAKKVINTIGMLPEDYFLYYEDTDYCFNATKNKFTLGIALDSIVYHKIGASTGGASKNEFAYMSRLISRKTFCKKYLNNPIGIRVGLLMALLGRLKRLNLSTLPEILQLITKKTNI